MFGFNGLKVNLRRDVSVVASEFKDPVNYNAVYGYTYCRGEVTLNERMFNPESAWNGKVENLQVLAHELAHEVQGTMCQDIRYTERLEESAQIASWEVLASMANEGSRPALHALVVSLEKNAYRASLYRAMRDRQLPYFLKRFRKIVGEENFSAWERMRRANMSDVGGLHDILRRYSYDPLKTIIESRKTGWEVIGLSLPIVEHAGGRVIVGRIAFKLDDLKYFLEHAEGLVEALN